MTTTYVRCKVCETAKYGKKWRIVAVKIGQISRRKQELFGQTPGERRLSFSRIVAPIAGKPKRKPPDNHYLAA